MIQRGIFFERSGHLRVLRPDEVRTYPNLLQILNPDAGMYALQTDMSFHMLQGNGSDNVIFLLFMCPYVGWNENFNEFVDNCTTNETDFLLTFLSQAYFVFINHMYSLQHTGVSHRHTDLCLGFYR